MYKVSDSGIVVRTSDGASIPDDPDNKDYQAYLAWVSAGNSPAPSSAAYDYSAAREQAYRAESDPLFFKEQRGEVPAGTWLAKVADIKSRWPK